MNVLLIIFSQNDIKILIITAIFVLIICSVPIINRFFFDNKRDESRNVINKNYATDDAKLEIAKKILQEHSKLDPKFFPSIADSFRKVIKILGSPQASLLKNGDKFTLNQGYCYMPIDSIALIKDIDGKPKIEITANKYTTDYELIKLTISQFRDALQVLKNNYVNEEIERKRIKEIKTMLKNG